MAEYDICKVPVVVSNKKIKIEFDTQMKSRVLNMYSSKTVALGNFGSSHYITTQDGIVEDFQFRFTKCNEINNKYGHGMKCTISGTSNNIEKILYLNVYDVFPSTVFIKTQYKNLGTSSVKVTGWVNNQYTIHSNNQGTEPPFWSFQGASYKERLDWVLPLNSGFSRENFMGMNNADYGGGIPLTDVWKKDIGITVGHCECGPKLVSFPVEVSEGKATISVTMDTDIVLESGETMDTIETFVMLHQGDCFNSLAEYRNIMEINGLKTAPINKEGYEPTWCSWGYERNFKVNQIYEALPMVKKLGFKWVCIDDGWQYEEGDYELSKEKFPAGEADIKHFVRKIHKLGFKVQLWWIPMACDPKSLYYSKHPDNVILDANGNKQKITWWDNYYLCPACEDVKQYTKESVRKILKDWDFDGLKIDGQHLNAAPLCYNKNHHHKNPEDSYEAVPEFFKLIYDEAKRIKPDALIMFCPCGTCCSFFTMPYFDMPVASDAESSWQVRSRGKVIKALMGSNVPYNGDHVELSDDECDFASTVGIGGVINTKFTWPVGSSPVSIVKDGANFDLHAEKEVFYQRWIDIYNEKMLSSGEYIGNLYSFGFDVPECHVIRKSNKMYYSFYADNFNGEVTLRGLDNKPHAVFDYVNKKKIAKLQPDQNKISINFEKFLLIEVSEAIS